MFNAQIKQHDDKQVRHTFLMYVDTLHEAEILVCSYFDRMYDSRLFWLDYNDDLIYTIYNGTTEIGTVKIMLGD